MRTRLKVDELLALLGQAARTLRLDRNLDQQSLAAEAGVSLSALKSLESGSGTTLRTFIQVLRALGREEWLKTLAPAASINPLNLPRDAPLRQRARRRTQKNGR